MAAVSEKNLPLDISVSFDPYAGEPGRDGEQFARPAPDGKVHFRIIAKDAKEVTARMCSARTSRSVTAAAAP